MSQVASSLVEEREVKAAASAFVAPSSSPALASFDFLVQSSLVGLFAAYGVAAAPLTGFAESVQPEVQDISVAMPFECSPQSGPGRLTLSMPRLLLDVMKS